MNKATRMLVMTGMAIVAGATFSAGPASAASASPAPSPSKTTTQSTKDWGHDRSRIVGYFSNPFTCNRVGRLGEMRDRWDDYDCIRVHGDWALSVSENDWDDWNRPFDLGGHHFGGHWGGFRQTRQFFPFHHGHR